VEDHTFASKMNAYCNQLGLDIDLAAGSIGSSVESYQRRTLKKSDTDGIKLEWGNAEGALELIRTIGDKDEPHGVTVLGDEYCEMVCCIDFLEDGADCDPEKQAKIMKTK
jgi:aldehyde:ferredoxin oxidoreductase